MNIVKNYYDLEQTKLKNEYCVVDGLIEGIRKEYNEDGLIKCISHFVHNKIHGECQEYENGKLLISYNTINGNVEGEMKEFDENGKLILIENYLNDELNGKHTEFYDNGKVKMVSHFVNGKQEGKCEQFYYSGNLAITSYFVNNKLNGKCIAYNDENDKIKWICNYVDGYLEGEYTRFDNDYQVFSVQNFDKGKLVV